MENAEQVVKVTGRGLKPDPRFNSLLVAKFVNSFMLDGKKSQAYKTFYTALDIIGKKVSDVEPLDFFTQVINNVKPFVEVKSKRIGGATYQVPVEVKKKRQQTLAFRWIIQAARGKKGKPLSSRLASEFMDAYNKEGAAMTTRQNLHRMAEANKAFSHFA